MRPHIFVTETPVTGLRSVDDLRKAIHNGHAQELWGEIIAAARGDIGAEVLLPGSVVEGRPAGDIRSENRDYYICRAAGQRVLQSALACLVTEDLAHRDAALRQMDALFDPDRWPIWRDMAHESNSADLRTGMLACDCAVAYDWLHTFLSPGQRKWVIAGIDRCGIQPFWRTVQERAGWLDAMSNWMTCVVGGLGIAAMALGEDHPDGQRLVEFSIPRMESYVGAYGPEGEFNESVGYAGATVLLVRYFMARWYATGGRVNRLSGHPFLDTCLWQMYQTLPPGRTAAFGDAIVTAAPPSTYFAAVAAASRNELLQWYYLHYSFPGDPAQAVWRLLWFDDGLGAKSSEGHLPRGRLFAAHGACVSSRTDWDPKSTPCMVYGKAGVERLHEHHDAGQVCIDGYGRRFIVDLGSPPGYPGDFFGPNRWNYYNASSWGHNVLNFGDEEMSVIGGQIAPVLGSHFDDELGGWWRMDLSEMYHAARCVHRTVVHLNPRIVVVLDEAQRDEVGDIVLRWHTVGPAELGEDGGFILSNEGVSLAGRVVSLDGEELSLSQHKHAYRAPHDRHRLGHLLDQPNESFLQARVHTHRCRLLSVFAVFPPGQNAGLWHQTGDALEIETPQGAVRVTAERETLTVENTASGAHWQVDLQE